MTVRGADAPNEPAVAELVEQARAGSLWAVGRLLTLTELRETAPLVARVIQSRGAGSLAHIVGITGPPGAGKSTTVSALVGALRTRDLRVAVLAVDPSSPFSGGALLGDRTRMRAHASDPAVFIRSMSSRGQLGGLSQAAPLALRVFESVGFDVVLLETVGVGQSEVDVVRAADTVVLVSAPGMGDELQAAKAGILEIADVYVVNKADQPGSAELVRQLRRPASFGPAGCEGTAWHRPVVRTVASSNDVDELVTALSEHRAHLIAGGERARRRRSHAAARLRSAASSAFDRWFVDGPGSADLAEFNEMVLAGELDETEAVLRLLDRFRDQPTPLA